MPSLIVSCYLLIVVIWSTTPLAILWSQDSFSAPQALFWRMALGWLSVFLFLLFTQSLPKLTKPFVIFFTVSGGGLFLAMSLIYAAAPFISSGLIAVLHGLLPLLTAVFARVLLNQSLNRWQWLALWIGLSGLVLLLWSELGLNTSIFGLTAVTCAVATHALTAVLVKKTGASVPIAHQLLGSLTVVTVGCALWLGFSDDAFLPATLNNRSILSVAYLALIGSVLGFYCYYLLLRKTSPITVGTITLLTPLTSMWVGNVLNNEQFAWLTITGTLVLLVGLGIYLVQTTHRKKT